MKLLQKWQKRCSTYTACLWRYMFSIFMKIVWMPFNFVSFYIMTFSLFPSFTSHASLSTCYIIIIHPTHHFCVHDI